AVGQVGEIADRALSASWRRRLVLTNTHVRPSCLRPRADRNVCPTNWTVTQASGADIPVCPPACCSPLEELDRGALGVERDDRLLPVGQVTEAEPIPPLLAAIVLRADLVHAHVKQFLDRRLDLQLARPRVDAERVGVAVLRLVRALLG